MNVNIKCQLLQKYICFSEIVYLYNRTVIFRFDILVYAFHSRSETRAIRRIPILNAYF